MTGQASSSGEHLTWVEPEIRELDVLDTFAFPFLGADARGNPSPDCQRS